LIRQLAASNPDLRAERSEPAGVSGQRALMTTLHNCSPFPNETEVDWLVTVPRPEGLFYLIFIATQSEFERVRGVFDQMLQSVRLN